MRTRKRLWIHPEIQMAFVLRCSLYWLECLLTVFFMTVCWKTLTEPVTDGSHLIVTVTEQSLPILIASLLLLPLVMIDAVRISHRFVGPLFRVRNTLRALSGGHSVGHITYRDGDYWKEFADDVNQLIDYVESLRRRTDDPQPSPAEPLVASSRPTP